MTTGDADRREGRRTVTGHYAGSLTRAVGAAVDVGVIMGTYTVMVWGAGLLWDAFFHDVEVKHSALLATLWLTFWAFIYNFGSLAISGQTIGKAMAGARVLTKDGSTLTVRRAFVRTLVMPLSALAFGLGYVLIVFQRAHRALHDLIAGTCVVYDWGTRSAQLPGPLSEFLARNAEDPADTVLPPPS